MSSYGIELTAAEDDDDTKYVGESGWVMARENGLTPNGNQLGGRWVLRDPHGEYVDHDQYRHDLAERHNIHLSGRDTGTAKPAVVGR